MLQGFQALLALLVLLPGFVSARIARSLSAPSDQSDVERIIDALIFSFFIYVFYLFLFGGTLPLDWTVPASPANSTQLAVHVRYWRLLYLCVAPVFLGLLWGSLQYRDIVLHRLRTWNLTNRTTDVSLWNATFRQYSGTVQVALADGREIVGWLQQYADTGPERSVFLSQAAWVNADGSQIDIPGPGILLTDKSAINSIMFLDNPADSAVEKNQPL